jgi:hypothetical protein
MTTGRRPLVAGNWKMNGLKAAGAELAKMMEGARALPKADLMVCPPFTLLALFAGMAKGSKLAVGAQDCHAEPSGAFTGDIAAEMLADAGAAAVIVGHSERRTYHHETDDAVRAKARRRGARASPQSSASARPRTSVSAARRSTSSALSSTARSRRLPRRRTWWLPTSRYGRSAPA